MKQIKTYEGFFDFLKKKTFDTKEDEICYKYGIKNYTINSDGTIDVNGNVDLSMITGDVRIWQLPLVFGEVSGDFDINGNTGMIHYLRTLKGCPQTVGGGFYCRDQRLKSLEFCPKIVKGRFDCSGNNIRTFEFFPKSVGQFRCWNNPIEVIWNLISKNDICDNDVIDLINEYDCVREEGVVVERFIELLKEIGKDLEGVEYQNFLRDLKKSGYEIID